MGQTHSFSPLTYTVCGLRVRSNRNIPDLISTEIDCPDVEVIFGEHPEFHRFERPMVRHSSKELTANGDPTVRLWEIKSRSLYVLLYGDGTKFVIAADGSRLWASWIGESTLEDTLTYLLGPVLGFVLRLRGVTCLHASAIVVDDVAIALCGPGGAGKSTMAARFSAMGYPVLADDIVTLYQSGATFLVQPAPARLRLWPSAVKHFYGDGNALPRLTPSWEKRYLDLRTSGQFPSEPFRLAAIYILGNSECGEIVEGPRSQRMIQLAGNVYVNYLLPHRFRRRDFVRIADVVNVIPVRQVNVRDDFAALEGTCQTILHDFRSVRARFDQAAAAGRIPTSFSCVG